ncbi:MAG: SpoIID/LytB domain-containing protein [Deltaproteobacteria bacterium]|nr:SpoIID/LytB domain-containing protein [Deltaproteobacteria bacterium]
MLVALAAELPPPQPSGMDLLYNDRVPFAASGEPLVTLGIASGRRRLVVRAPATMVADYYEGGMHKRATVRPLDAVELTIVRAQPARRRHYVDLEGVALTDAHKLDVVLSGWRARGYPQVEALEEGPVLGIAGRLIDNREYRVVLPAQGPEAAQRIISEVYERFGVRAFASARLSERPWGELLIRVNGTPLGRATSFVRFAAPGAAIQVDAVEHAAGYAWHGVEDRRYEGEIYGVVDPDGLLAAVNVLGAERVLAGVVPAELFASSPPEALKAQAVAARNQLLAKLGKRHHADPFRLCSEQHCQVYPGVLKEDPRSTAAVTATTGEVLFHEGHLVDTVYSSTCGGHTEDNDAVWGNDPDPALRGRPDFDVTDPALARFADGIDAGEIEDWLASRPLTYCSRASLVRPEKLRWQKTLSADELAKLLAPRYAGLGHLTDMAIEERGAGGRVIGLRLMGQRGEAIVLHELPIRKLLGGLNSGAFVMNSRRDEFGKLLAVTFTGGGWGHGVGMCQLGAVGRAEAGMSYLDILGHYYSGAGIEHLYGPLVSARRASTP